MRNFIVEFIRKDFKEVSKNGRVITKKLENVIVPVNKGENVSRTIIAEKVKGWVPSSMLGEVLFITEINEKGENLNVF